MSRNRNRSKRSLTVGMVVLFVFFSGCGGSRKRLAGVPDSPYLQKDKVVLEIRKQTGQDPVSVALLDAGRAIVATGSQLFVANNHGELQSLDVSLPRDRLRDVAVMNGQLVLLGRRALWTREADTWRRLRFPRVLVENPDHLLRGPDGSVWAVGPRAILRLPPAGQRLVSLPLPSAREIVDVAFGPDRQAYVLSGSWIFRMTDGGWQQVAELPALREKPTAFAVTESGMWIGTPFGLLHLQGVEWDTVGGRQGLPYEDVTSLAGGRSVLWVGTSWGVCRYENGHWEYYANRRWLPDDRVRRVVAESDTSAWILTDSGVSHLFKRRMTLADKARIFESRIPTRHTRFGLIGECTLLEPGRLDTFVLRDNDNDGLWSAMYLAAECFRWAATHEPEARERAIRTFEALERLERITGIPGFPARSFVRIEDRVYGGEWHPTPDGKWKWKGDTSSDEIVGHLFAYPIFYDLVAEGEYRERVRALVHRIADHILRHNYHLVDLDGRPTTWGVWHPDSLNNNPNWSNEKGLNSLEILSFLRVAHHVTGEPRFLEAYYDLAVRHHYAENTIKQKVVPPGEVNHSDDELAFLSYYGLFRYETDKKLRAIYVKSMERSWAIEKPEKNPLWNYIATYALGRDCGLEDAVETLRDVPLDLISWRMKNSQRADVEVDQRLARDGRRQATRPFPPSERGMLKWNGNPYLLNDGDAGRIEDEGAFWLLPYWMGRYYGYIVQAGIASQH